MNKPHDPSTPTPDPHPSTNTTIPTAVLDAGARAYAADTYRGTRGLDGQAVVWNTLSDTDRAACTWKARVVLEAALPVLAERSSPEPDFGSISDGLGSEWPRCAPDCHLEVVRPGSVQCDPEDDCLTEREIR